MNKEVRQSKIYSYFHGAGTMFQRFVVIVGILCILMGTASGQARVFKIESAEEKYENLKTKRDTIEEEYTDLYYTYATDPALNFLCEKYTEAEIVENDRNTAEKEAHNEALKKYNDAVAKVEEKEKEIEKTKLGKNLTKYKNECYSIYSKYTYRLDCTFGEEAEIERYDWYEDEKREYNKALKAYLNAEKALNKDSSGKKLIKLKETAEKLQSEYEKIYNEYTESVNFETFCVFLEKAEIEENDKYKAEKKALNDIYAKYEKAAKKALKASEKLENLSFGGSVGQVLFPIAGVIIILIGLIWSIIKKNSFDKASCEAAYDEELQIKIEEAKEKALEKLNIVAEQIDKVEPVVLNGIANYESDLSNKAAGKLAGFINLFTYVGTILLGTIVAVIYSFISVIFGGAFFIPVIGAIAISAILGRKIYNKYEKDSYVNPKEIKRLENFNPSLRFRLGTDNVVRVSLPAITVYMFGEDQVYMYYQYLDIVTGKVFCEGINEYFYEDIVGVISSQETKKVLKGAGLFKSETIEYLRESITVVTSGCQHKESYIVPVGKSLLDTSFVGMRNLIRQKKSDS